MNTTKYWNKSKGKYGRTVYYLVDTEKNRQTVGVVIKHPFVKPGEHGAYWYAKWGMCPSEEIVEFSTLKDAKAGLLEATS
jgi:hypothetical protein